MFNDIPVNATADVRRETIAEALQAIHRNLDELERSLCCVMAVLGKEVSPSQKEVPTNMSEDISGIRTQTDYILERAFDLCRFVGG